MLKNDPASRDLGKTYAAKAPEYLMKELGAKTVDLSQFAMFHTSAIAWMTAQGFVTVLEKAGVEEAERFLALVAAAIPAAVRLKGAPFMVQLDVKLTPVDEQAPQKSPEFEPCRCQLGENQECPVCPKALSEEYRDLTGYLVGYVKEISRRTTNIQTFCVPCGAKYADSVLAEIVKEGGCPDPESESLKQQAAMIAIQTFQAFGLTDAPLTVQALQERQG